ncbi:MAG: M48 family metallopeptidase [Chromatiales bacterium]|nr:M48 family metallopeptidase [Chromatiales bacterium]
MHSFTLIFLIALSAGFAVQLWLLTRHQKHIRAHRAAVPEAFSSQVTLEQHQKAADYSDAKINISRINLVYGTLLLLGWTLGGGIDLLAQWWSVTGLGELNRGIGLIFSLFLIMGLLELPLSIYSTFVIEERFGFNRSTPKRFITDLLLQTLLGIALGGPLLLVILWLMGEAGSYWWLAAWLVWMAFTLFITWIFPTVIAPIFNKFTPLEENALKQRIHALLERTGFTSKGIFVMDGSKRSGHGNAYFTGFGKNKRIVFYDTLLESLSEQEVEAVLAHELGHFKRNHIKKGMVLSFVITLLGLALLGWLTEQSWFYQALGVTQSSNALALTLFMLVVPVFTQFLNPISAWFSRKNEFEADDFAVEQTGSEPLITALVKLYRENASTLTPDPLYSAFHDSHPPAPVRVAHLSSKIATHA